MGKPVSSLRYREQPPEGRLRSAVECFWMVEDPVPRRNRSPERILPDGCPELIVHLAKPFSRWRGGRWQGQPTAFLAGTLSRPWLVRGGSCVRTIGIRFRPGAVTSFFPLGMAKATNCEVSLADLVGLGPARHLVNLLGQSTEPLETAEAWLASLPRIQGDRLAQRAVREILKTRGRKRVAQVASCLGIHPRRLERAFARDLGIRPKLFSRIVRLQAALAVVEESESAVDWALEAGYFDQAHLARDFRVVAGRPPRLSRNADGEMASHFSDPERLRAYLEGE